MNQTFCNWFLHYNSEQISAEGRAETDSMNSSGSVCETDDDLYGSVKSFVKISEASPLQFNCRETELY